MQNSMFLAVLRLIFALKTKTAPPNEIGVRAGEDREMMMTSRSGCQCTWRPFFFGDHLILDEEKTLWISAKTFFFLEITWIWTEKLSEFQRRPFFWRSLDFGQKNILNFGEDLFFWDHLVLPQSNSRLMKIRVKFVYGWIKIQKKPPPFCKILTTRLIP